MIRLRIILFIVFLLLTQWSVGQMSSYKSLYIYNFIKRIEWPATESSLAFVVIVMGDHETFLALDNISKTKKIGERRIEVQEAITISDIENADLIYIAYSKRRSINEAVDWISNKPILLVSDYKSSKIVDINLVESTNELKFMVHPEKIRKKGLKVSDYLIQLGKHED